MRQYIVFGIFLFISEHGKVNARDIAERFEISTRTVYRYLDALSYVGVPIVAQQGRGGGISILPSFKLASLNFSNEEKSVIKSALMKEANNDCVKKILSALN